MHTTRSCFFILMLAGMMLRGEMCVAPGIHAVTLKINHDQPIVIDTLNPDYSAEAANYEWTLQGSNGRNIALRARVVDLQVPALQLRPVHPPLRPGSYRLRVHRKCSPKTMKSCTAGLESGQVITIVKSPKKMPAKLPAFHLESIRVHGSYPARATILLVPETEASLVALSASLLLMISSNDPKVQQAEWRNRALMNAQDRKLRFGQEDECTYKPQLNYGQAYTLSLVDVAVVNPQPLASWDIHIPLPPGVPAAAWDQIAEYEALRQDPTLKPGNDRWLRYTQLQNSFSKLAPYYPALSSGFIFTADQLQRVK